MSAYGSNTAGQPTAPVPTTDGDGLVNKLLIVGIVGSGLAFVGSFLAWVSGEYTESGQTETETASGMDGDGTFTLIASIVAIALFAFGMVRKNPRIAAISIVPTLVTLAFGVLNVLDPERLAESSMEKEAEDLGLTGAELDQAIELAMEAYEFSPGMGLYIVLLGAVAALVAGAMVVVKGRPSS